MEEYYQNMRHKWFNNLAYTADIKDHVIKERLDVIDEDTMAMWKTMVKTKYDEIQHIWPDLYKPQDLVPRTSSSFIKITYYRLRDLAVAYQTKGCQLYQNQEVRDTILKAIDWIYCHWYNELVEEWYGNSWNWDIGCPLGISELYILMYDDLSIEQIERYERTIDHFIPAITTSTGANRIWKARIIALRGIIGKKQERLQYARDAIEPVFKFVTKGDGFYHDGSFIQHDHHPYTGGYGISLMMEIVPLIHLLSHTPWEVEKDKLSMLYSWIENAFEPVMHKGLIMDAIRGRGMGTGHTDQYTGFQLIDALLQLAESAPSNRKKLFLGWIKYWILSDEKGNFLTYGTVNGVTRAKRLLDDDTIAPEEPKTMYAHFASMDRFMKRTEKYSFMLALHSSRIRNYEITNRQNLKGWHTGDGMYYIYDNDLNRYADNFWLTVDAHRLPGVTAIYGEEIINGKLGDADWVGGSYLGNAISAIGMRLSPYGSILTAKKSWFMLDGVIVCLGSDIQVHKKNTIGRVETTIENYKVNELGKSTLIVNNEEILVQGNKEWIQEDASWIHMTGNCDGADVGYYFPNRTSVHMKKGEQSGSLWDINQYDNGNREVVTRRYLTMWLDHGEEPDKEQYGYLLMPGKSVEDVKAYASKPSIDIIENSSRVHSVIDKINGILAINFWESGECRGIHTDQPCSIIIKQDNTKKIIAVSDPTQTDALIKLKIPEASSLVDKHDRVSQHGDTFYIDTKHMRGQPVKLVVQ